MAKAQRLLVERQLLQRDCRRPEGRGPRLLDGHLPPGDRRRRQDVGKPGRAVEARRQPLDLDRPSRHRSLHRRQRRWHLRELRSGSHVELQGQPARGAVLQDLGRRCPAGLPRGRRHPGQHDDQRAVAHPDRARRVEPRLDHDLGRRRIPHAGRARQP